MPKLIDYEPIGILERLVRFRLDCIRNVCEMRELKRPG